MSKFYLAGKMMPLFAEVPPDTLRDFWLLPEGSKHKVNSWPYKNVERVDSVFRLEHTQPRRFFAMRYFFEFRFWDTKFPVLHPNIHMAGWLDMESRGSVPNTKITGNVGVSGDPFSIGFHFESKDLLDIAMTPGIEFFAGIIVDDNAFFLTAEYPLDTMPCPWDIDTNASPGINHQEGGTTAIHYDTREYRIHAVSDCYNFPGGFLMGPGFAGGNGVDAYVRIPAFIPEVITSFRITVDIRLRQLTENSVLARSDGGDAFVIAPDVCRWGVNNGPITPNIPLNTWVSCRFERNFSVPTGGRYRLWVDDDLRADFGGSNIGLDFNRIIGDRGGAGGPRFGNLDVRDLKVELGPEASPTVLLDMPLRDHGQDLGPLSRTKSTFNMELTTCPLT